jgi:1-acyl-sn-glycerol-3-phosphate acyltransferase
VRFVAKQQLFWIPLFGWALYALGMVPVARRGRREDIERLNATPRGNDIIFFAEGTRSPAGQLQTFKKGAVAYALHQGLPLLPVAVVGGYECLKPRSLRVRGGYVAVIVGKPIPTAGLTPDDRDRLLVEVHAAVRHLRAQGLAALDLRR